jgi:hypothetical protein
MNASLAFDTTPSLAPHPMLIRLFCFASSGDRFATHSYLVYSSSGVASRNQVSDELQVTAHIGLH